MNVPHPQQTVCILSASLPLCTMQQNIQKTKGSAEGENGETDQTINPTTRDGAWLGLCVCVHRRGRQKARGRRGEMKTNAESERDRGRQRKERQREKSNLQEHNKKLYLWQKRTHKGICLAVCSSRILRKFIKLEPFKRRQSSKLYYRGGKERRGNGWGGGVKGGKKLAFQRLSLKFFYFSHALSNLPAEFCSPSWCG